MAKSVRLHQEVTSITIRPAIIEVVTGPIAKATIRLLIVLDLLNRNANMSLNRLFLIRR